MLNPDMTTSEFMEQGRKLAETHQLIIGNLLAQGYDTVAARKKAVTLFSDYAKICLHVNPRVAHALVLIHDRFGQSDRRVELAKHFDIDELARLARKHNEVIEIALSTKKLNPRMTRKQFRVLLAGH